MAETTGLGLTEGILARVDAYIDEHIPKFVEELKQFLRIPSVSDDRAAAVSCAEFVCDAARSVGVDARVVATPGNPVVFGTVGGASRRAPLIFYGHYDVVPPDPLDEWSSPPFEPTIREDHVYARGAADDKGQMFAHLKALEALKALGVPVGPLKLVFDGEEEVSSPSLSGFVTAHAPELRADLMVDADGGMDRTGRAQIELGARGILHAELSVRVGAERQLSCNHDNFIANPAWRLVSALSTLRGPDGQITLDGFFEDVREPTDRELGALGDLLREAPTSTRELLARFGVETFLGGADATEVLRRQMFSPTFSINGLGAGYVGPGVRTAIPDDARARLSVRLVPDQRPDDILRKIRAHLERRGFRDVEVRQLAGKVPSRTSLDDPGVVLVTRAVAEAHGRDPLIYPSTSGGASPPHFLFHELGMACVRVPYAQFRERNAHRPNESLAIRAFRDGIRVSARLIRTVAAGDLPRAAGRPA